MSARELFEADIEFHETLASWSGNRFFLEALVRVDHLRRLVEYRFARGDREGAARLLERHLKGAATSKALS